jgi:quinol monooxygenase YgiN
MSYMLVQHEVEDFARWKAVFDSKVDLRKANGEISAQIFHDAQDPNKLTLLFEWDSLDRARQYAQNPALKAAMQEAGVIVAPTIHFLKGD